jgi:hypothetical protein
MIADRENVRRIVDVSRVRRGDGMGAFGVDDALAVAQIAMTIFPTLGKSPGKENYKKIFKPNADQFISAYQRDFVTGAAAVGWNVDAIASALSDYLAEVNIQLTPAQLKEDASPSTASVAGGIAGNVSSFFQGITGGNYAPFIIAGGAGLVLLLLLRK